MRPLALTAAVSIASLTAEARILARANNRDVSFERAVHNAVERLPGRSPTVSITDADEARPEVREALLKLDAFITKGGRVVYVVKQSAVLEAAARGSTFHECMLASIIWHEMAHIDGADERGARRAEEQLWTQFVRDGAVDAITGLRYLQALEKRPDDQLIAVPRSSTAAPEVPPSARAGAGPAEDARRWTARVFGAGGRPSIRGNRHGRAARRGARAELYRTWRPQPSSWNRIAGWLKQIDSLRHTP